MTPQDKIIITLLLAVIPIVVISIWIAVAFAGHQDTDCVEVLLEDRDLFEDVETDGFVYYHHVLRCRRPIYVYPK